MGVCLNLRFHRAQLFTQLINSSLQFRFTFLRTANTDPAGMFTSAAILRSENPFRLSMQSSFLDAVGSRPARLARKLAFL
jgi:hypothetical protein